MTWTESQVTVLSADNVGAGARMQQSPRSLAEADKISPSSLATSFGRTESLSSEHLFRDEADGCASSSKGTFKEFCISVHKGCKTKSLKF